MEETCYFAPDDLRKAIHDLLGANGSPEEEADLVSRRLIKADLTGHPSHGVIRARIYMEMMRRDMIKPGATPEITLDHGSIALVNGNRAYGQVAAEHTMKVAIDRCRTHGIAAVGVTNLAHAGRLADYAVAAARADYLGMVFTATGGVSELVAPFEGSARRMSTNPMAVAVPSDREFPIVFDMATCVWAEGKFKVLLDAGKTAPENTLIDKEGRPTIRPADLYDGGAILPLGGEQGYKGYLLNFMIEVLAGLLTGGGHAGCEGDRVFNNCTMMIVIDVAKFRQLPQFKAELEALIRFLKETPVLEGKEVLYPGELEARREVEMLKTGIPLAVPTVERLQKELDRCGVPVRLEEMGSGAPLG